MQKTTVAVRHAEPADIPDLVHAYTWLFAPPGMTPADWNPTVAAARLTRVLAGPNSAVLIALDTDQLVGLCSMYLDIESVRFGQRCWVEDLAVHPDQRSTGIGAAILTTAQHWAADHGATHLELDSATTRVDAHRFYDRHQPTTRSITFSWQLP